MSTENFITAFESMTGELPQIIVKWLLDSGCDEEKVGAGLSSLASQLINNEKFVEACCVLKTFRRGITDDNAFDVIDKTIRITESKCIQKCIAWLDSSIFCDEEDKEIFLINLKKNVRRFIEKRPQLLAYINNQNSDCNIKICKVFLNEPNKEFKYTIQYLDRPAKEVASISSHAELTYGQVVNGVCFCGMGNGVIIQDIYKITKFKDSQVKIGLYVVEPSITVIRANLLINDLTELIDSKRVFFYTGENGPTRFLKYLKDEIQFAPSRNFRIDKEVSKIVVPCLNKIVENKKNREAELSSQTKNYYSSRTDKEWLEIYNSKRPLKVMGLTCLFTVYLQYCMRDWLSGFSNLGCETRLLIEKAPNLRLTNEYFYNELHNFKPDLILGICYNKQDMTFQIPSEIPFINWQQDKMPHNIEAGAADSLGKKDFIVTANYASQWMLEHHYPREKMYILPYFPVNTDIYYPIQLSASDIEKYGCDISFVSNCSETPEENLRKLRERFSCHGKDVDTLLINMYDFVLDKFCRWENYPVNNKEYNDIFQIVHNEMGMPEVPNAIREEITYEFLYVGDRILRQKPLEKLSGDGFNLSLYGIGWESHPVLKKHSRGIAKNGEELNIINNASKIVYHAISPTTLHPRFMDAAASGSFVLVKKIHDDADPVSNAFEPEKEFVYFEGPEDISSTAEYYLSRVEERNIIGKNIYQKSQQYSYKVLAETLVGIIRKDPMNVRLVPDSLDNMYRQG